MQSTLRAVTVIGQEKVSGLNSAKHLSGRTGY
jgi:hypothetical protein